MLGSESSSLLWLQGVKVPGNESSTHGAFTPMSKSTCERKLNNLLVFTVQCLYAMAASGNLFE